MKAFIQLIVSVLLLVLLYGFSRMRSADRVTADLKVELMNETGSTLNEAAVNKLLIQKENANLLAGGDRVVLKQIEDEVGKIPSVARVEAFRRFSGQVVVQIWTRIPVARISGSPSYLVDSQGIQLPLSEYRQARVPLVSGAVQPDRLQDLCALIRVIQEDPFLAGHIIGIEVGRGGGFVLHGRTADYVIHVPDLKDLDIRFRNYKVFYQKASRDSLLDRYRIVDLTCSNQVVCTKK